MGVRLDRVVTAGFVSRVSTLSQSPSTSVSGISSSSATSVDFSSSLRIGAKAYTSSIQNLNSAISLVNLTRDALVELKSLTEQMISLAERAAGPGQGSDERGKAHTRFKDLVRDFRRIVADTKSGGLHLLNKDDLTEIFTRAGLDPQKADSIASVFRKFVVPDGEESLASEAALASRPVAVSPGAYLGPTSRQMYRSEVYGSVASSQKAGVISTVNTVVKKLDSLNNPGVQSAVTIAVDGTVTSQPAGSFGATQIDAILAVNETTGYSIVESSANPLGHNGSGLNQLFLLDERGRFLQQLTSTPDSGAEYKSADLSADSSRIVVVSASDGINSVDVIELDIEFFGVAPETLSVSNIESGTSEYSTLKINNDGNLIYFFKGDDTPSSGHRLWSSESVGDDFNIDAAIGAGTVLGFVSGDALAFLDLLDPDGPQVKKYETSDTVSTLFAAELGNFGVLEGQGDGYVASITAGGSIQLFRGSSQVDLSDGPGLSYELGSVTSASLSLAFNKNAPERVDIGVLATPAGATGPVMRRLSYNSNYGSSIRYAPLATDVNAVLDGGLTSRLEAGRTLADLKSLNAQLDENLEAIDSALDTLAQTVDLARGTAVAFLELSDRIDSDASAEEVAEELRNLIRNNARKALSQAENLEPLLVAALTLDA